MKNNRMIQMRVAYDMTQDDIAKLVGCSQSMIAYIEAGKRDPKKHIKIKLARLYGVTVEWLFYEQINDQKSLELYYYDQRALSNRFRGGYIAKSNS